MKKKILLLTIFFIFVISFLTLILTYNYLDPYRNVYISVLTISFTFIFSLTSFLTLLLYIIKKAYYRWEIFILHIFSSLRQSLIVSFFIVISLLFYKFWVLSFVTFSLLFLIFWFFEMLFQNME